MNAYLIFYNIIVVPVLWIVFRFGGFINKKIHRGIIGRKYLFRDLQINIKSWKGAQRIWFHASSLGEFEQAKPIIAAIKQSYPHIDILATFFSPSGFENSKNYSAKIYPNPFSTQTTLQTDQQLENATLTLYNSLGQTVKKIKWD